MNHGSAYDPYGHAALLGIEVVEGDLDSWHAVWVPRRRRIVVAKGLTAIEIRSALAHEMGHICLGHTASTPKHERMADRWAARHLIAEDELCDVASQFDDPGRWCHELVVMPDLLEVYMRDVRPSLQLV